MPIASRSVETGARPLTVSVGIAGCDSDARVERAALLEVADAALYQAKLGGRDRVVVCPNPVAGTADQSGPWK